MATLAEKRKEAKGMGIPATAIRGAENVRELQKIIDSHSNGGSEQKVSKKSSAVKKSAVAKKSVAKKSAAKKSTAAKSNSKSASSTKSPAKSTTAKRTSTAKSGGDNAGRHTLDGVNYSNTDGWNAREGSAPDRIVKALRKFKGNRSKVFDALKADVWDFAGKKKRDGSKRTKAEAEAMLVYRIARTDWDFALKTGQHEKSENRVEHGTGGTGAGTFKRAGSKKSTAKSNSTAKASTKATAKKSTTKATAKKGGKAAARKAGKAAAKKRK
jgi:hypothetical protein